MKLETQFIRADSPTSFEGPSPLYNDDDGDDVRGEPGEALPARSERESSGEKKNRGRAAIPPSASASRKKSLRNKYR